MLFHTSSAIWFMYHLSFNPLFVLLAERMNYKAYCSVPMAEFFYRLHSKLNSQTMSCFFTFCAKTCIRVIFRNVGGTGNIFNLELWYVIITGEYFKYFLLSPYVVRKNKMGSQGKCGHRSFPNSPGAICFGLSVTHMIAIF